MLHCSPMLAVLLVTGIAATGAKADLLPVPRAYYDFEEIVDGTFRNVIAPGVFDGHLGVSPGDTDRNPTIVQGLFGSNQALMFTGNHLVGAIARVPTLVTDSNADGTDEDVFAGAFTVFLRADAPNTAQMNMVNADRGPVDTTTRGWYLDFSNSTTNTAGEYLLRPRFTAGTPTSPLTLHPTGTETTNYQNVDSVSIVWTPDPNPGGISEGSMAIYINGELFASQAHNWESVVVGETGFNIGLGRGVSSGNGITIDDLAIWNVALTPSEILAVHAQGVPLPEPGILVLLGLGGMVLTVVRPPRRVR